MQNICFVSLSSYGLFNPKYHVGHGGAELQMYLLATRLVSDNKYKINFIVGDYGQNKREYYKNICLYKSIKTSAKFRLLNAIRIFILLRKINSDIYITTTQNQISFIVLVYCKLFNKKIIHRTAHDTDVDKSFRKWPLFKRIIYLLTIKNVDKIIVQNKYQKDNLNKYYGRDSVVLKNSFNIKDMNFTKKDYILWVGRNIKFKQPHLIFQVAKKLPSLNFLMICSDTKQDYIKNMNSRISKINNLTYIEFVPFMNIQKYFNEAYLFTNTSTQEGFPNTFIQAGIGKTPIISLGVNPDNFITEKSCGLVAGNNLDEMILAIKKLNKNRVLYKKFSNNIFKYMNDNHNIDINIKVFKNIINNV